MQSQKPKDSREQEEPLRSAEKHYQDDSSHQNGWVYRLHLTLTIVMWLIGVAIVVIGAILVADTRMSGLKSLKNFRPLQMAAILAIIIGSAIFIIGVLGCIVVKLQNRVMILTYAVFLLCLILLEIATCILAWFYKKGQSLEYRLQYLINRVIGQYESGRAAYEERDDDWNFNRNILNFIEYTMHCCGSYGPNDYTSRGLALPQSCYHVDYYNNYNRSEEGCTETLQNFLLKYSLVIGLLCVMAMLLQIALVSTTFVLAKRSTETSQLSSQHQPKHRSGHRSFSSHTSA